MIDSLVTIRWSLFLGRDRDFWYQSYWVVILQIATHTATPSVRNREPFYLFTLVKVLVTNDDIVADVK